MKYSLFSKLAGCNKFMNVRASHILQAADELLCAKKFREVIKKLGEIDIASISPEEQADYNLIYCEACLSLSQYNLQNEIEQAVHFYRTTGNNENLARSNIYRGGWLFQLGIILRLVKS